MLRPSGAACSTCTRAPASRSTRGPTSNAGAVRAVEHDVEAVERRARRASTSRCATYASARVGVGVERRLDVDVGAAPVPGRASSARARLRSRPRRRPAACGRRRRSPSRRCRSTGCGSRRRSRPACPAPRRANAIAGVGSTPSSTGCDALATAARPRARASIRGPDSRVSRPMSDALRPQHPRDGATERDDERSSEIGLGVAAYAVGAEAQHASRRERYRFEYCGALRAFLRPYLRRSFSRASRRRRPAFFSTPRDSGSSATSARAMPRRIAPAWPLTPPPPSVASTS